MSKNWNVIKSGGKVMPTLQETHFTHRGKIRLDSNFIVFKAIRAKKGGKTAIAIHEDKNPKLIEEHTDEYEQLAVEIRTKEKETRPSTN